jgi:hypothetical protein
MGISGRHVFVAGSTRYNDLKTLPKRQAKQLLAPIRQIASVELKSILECLTSALFLSEMLNESD